MDTKTIHILFFDEEHGWAEDDLEVDAVKTDDEYSVDDENPEKEEQ